MTDREEIDEKINLLKTYRRRLAYHIEQQALLGLMAPFSLVEDISLARAEIKRIKVLLREWNVAIEDSSDDEEYSAAGQLSGALRNMVDMMHAPAVRSRMHQFHYSLELLNRQIQALQTYKDLHDQLHELQFGCYRLVMVGAHEFPQHQAFTESLSLYAIELQQIIDELWSIADRPNFPSNERLWIQQLLQAHEQLAEALMTLARAPFDRALYLLERVLNLQPTRINERLKDIARDLPFDELLRALASAKESIAVENDSRDQAVAIEQGIAAVEQVRERLKQLIDEHDTWQRFEPDLRQYENNPPQYVQQFTWLWQHELKPSLAELYQRRNDRWIRELQRVGERLDHALTEQTAATLSEAGRAFYSCFGKCFFQADKELKDQCNQLRLIDGPLKSVIGMFV